MIRDPVTKIPDLAKRTRFRPATLHVLVGVSSPPVLAGVPEPGMSFNLKLSSLYQGSIINSLASYLWFDLNPPMIYIVTSSRPDSVLFLNTRAGHRNWSVVSGQCLDEIVIDQYNGS